MGSGDQDKFNESKIYLDTFVKIYLILEVLKKLVQQKNFYQISCLY